MRLLAGAAVGAICCATAMSRQAGAPGPEVLRQAVDASYPALLDRVAADSLARTVIERLRTWPSPTHGDYRSVALSLRLIRELVPDDAQLLRYEIEAWDAAGDEEQALTSTRRLIELEPDDTVAQLRVLVARIDKLQDADQRLAAYDKLLGPAGEQIDASIRSRLALDAAMLARETGDEAGFLNRLTLATVLDRTNKAAAALHATYLLNLTNDPLERVELLANVILSDPMDPYAYENLAAELMAQGAYVGAERTYVLLGQLHDHFGLEVSVDQLTRRIILSLYNEGGEQVLSTFKKRVAMMEYRRQREREQLLEQGYDPGPDIPARLRPEQQFIQLAVRVALEKTDELEPGLELMQETIRQELEGLQQQYGNADPAQQAQLAAFVAERQIMLLQSRLLAEVQLDKAEETLSRLRSEESEGMIDEQALQRYEGWLAASRGDTMRARELLAPLVEDDYLARYGMAKVEELDGDTRAAMRHLAILVRDFGSTVAGAAAKVRLEKLHGTTIAPTPVARQLNTYIDALATELEPIVSGPYAFMSLRAEHVKTEVDLLDRVELVITLRNISRMPLGVGLTRSISSRFLISPKISVDGHVQLDLTAPEVLDLNRRLRLKPGEWFTIRLWAAPGFLSRAFDLLASHRISVRWRIVQGFEVNEQQRYVPGTMAVTADSDILTRKRAASITGPDEVKEIISQAHGADFLRGIIRIVASLADKSVEVDEETRVSRVSLLRQEIGARADSLLPEEKAFLLIQLVANKQYGESLDGTGLTDPTQQDSPIVQLALLLKDIHDPEDPRLGLLVESASAEISQIATLTRDRLTRFGDLDPGEEAPSITTDESSSSRGSR